MENSFSKHYFGAINEGLIKAVYKIKGQSVESESFFEYINNLLLKVKEQNSKIFFFGNGASAAFANHMALDFSKNAKILSRSLSDSAILTALSNDFSYDSALVEFIKIERIKKNDFVITISSSGNSKNIVNVLEYCKTNNIQTLALSGLKNDNKSFEISDYSIHVPMKTYGIVECAHQVFLHLILDNYMKIYEWDRESFQNMNHENFIL